METIQPVLTLKGRRCFPVPFTINVTARIRISNITSQTILVSYLDDVCDASPRLRLHWVDASFFVGHLVFKYTVDVDPMLPRVKFVRRLRRQSNILNQLWVDASFLLDILFLYTVIDINRIWKPKGSNYLLEK